MTYLSPYVLVEEFHLTYGQPLRVTPHLDVPQRELRVALIREELSELAEALEQNDFIEVVDALADILYVVYGAGITHGINLDYILGCPTHHSPADIIKQMVTLDLGESLEKTPHFNKEAIAEGIVKLESELEKYIGAGLSGNIVAFEAALSQLVVGTYIIAIKCSVDIDDVLAEVQRSNMSKLGEDGKPIYREDGKILKGPNFFTPNIAEVLTGQGWTA